MPIIFSDFWHVALCPIVIFNRGLLPQGIWGIVLRCSKSVSSNDLQSQIVWHCAPQGVWHCAPPWHCAPVIFAHFIFLARFGMIFGPKFYFWHAINPYHQRSYKVPHIVVVSPYHIRSYVERCPGSGPRK